MHKNSLGFIIAFFLFGFASSAQTNADFIEAEKILTQERNRIQDALPYLQRLIASDPNSAENNFLFADYYFGVAEYKKAIEYGEKAKPKLTTTRYKENVNGILLQCYDHEKLYKKLTSLAKEIVKENSGNMGAKSWLAIAYRRQAYYDSAIQVLNEIVKADTQHWYPFYTLARCHHGKNDIEMAEYNYNLAAARNPERPWPQEGLAEIALTRSDPKKALAHYNDAIAMIDVIKSKNQFYQTDAEGYAGLYTGRAMTKEFLQDYEGAIEDLNESIRFDPTNETTISTMARVKKKVAEMEKLAAASATRIGCFEGTCSTGTGAYRSSTGDVYRGQFVDGAKSGNGKMEFVTGDSYAGTFANDRFNSGTFTKSDGSKINFVNGQQEVSAAAKNVNYEDAESVKKARRGGFWRAMGDIVVGAAIISMQVAAEMEREDAANKAAMAKASKPVPTPSTSSKTTTTQAKQQPEKPKCVYYISWHKEGDFVFISNIYKGKPSMIMGGGVMWKKDRVEVSDKRNDLIRSYEDQGYEIRYQTMRDECWD